MPSNSDRDPEDDMTDTEALDKYLDSLMEKDPVVRFTEDELVWLVRELPAGDSMSDVIGPKLLACLDAAFGRNDGS